MKIVQIAPEIAAGSGVGGVAYNLEAAWKRAGISTERFTMREARGDWLPAPRSGLVGKLALLSRVVWFSTIGTLLARRMINRQPDAVVICHNDVLAGDVYVNHGILQVAMAARGRYRWRMARNPLHLFTAVRDAARYRLPVHRIIVNLTTVEETALSRMHPHLKSRTTVITNGVDTQRFVPPTPVARAQARQRLGLPDGVVNVLFIGHEFDRKGLRLILDAVVELPDVHVTVVGGTADMLAALDNQIHRLGLTGRVHVAGQVDDPQPWLDAADVLALPSAYEANALVVLEALACGIPVIATPVGYAPELIHNGVNGFLVERSANDVRKAIGLIADASDAERETLASQARAHAERHDWEHVAARYLALAAEVVAERSDEQEAV